jgi:energy-coupling factor transport system ATP-binding protein
LLLDEPLAQLDPRGAESLLRELQRLVREQNLAVLLVEHRLEQALEYSDRVLVMDDGRIVCEGPSDHPPLDEMASRGLQLPGLMELDARLAARGLSRDQLVGAPAGAPFLPEGTPHLVGRNLGFSFGSDTVLSGVNLEVKPGERLAIVGGNGAGKSTLLSVLSGDLDGGEVRRTGRLIDVPQEPDLALFCATVREELAHGPLEAGSPDVEKEVREAAEALGVLDLLDRPPQALSRGQRMRVAVAAALAAGPDILVLDEPTSGQDRGQVEQMMHSLAAHLGDRSLVFATHDLDLVARHATRVLVLEDGQCIADGEPAQVLANLPEEGPLVLPPLARLCLDKGWQPASARALVERS